MESIIAIYRMNELSRFVRARVIIKLGKALNYQFGANWTEPVVFELVSLLEPENEILKDENFIRQAKP